MLSILTILLSLITIYTQACGGLNPNNIADCFALHETNYCCYTKLKYDKNDTSICILYPKNTAFILPHIKQINISLTDRVDIDIDCGIVEASDNTCGPTNPQSINDCKPYSTSASPCCLFKSSTSSVCFFNDIQTSNSEQMFGFDIVCKADYKVYKTFLLIFILLIF